MEYPKKRVTSALLALAIFAAAAGPIFAQEPLAERYLTRLSVKSKRARTTGGGLLLAGGGLCIAGGLSMMAEADEDDFLGLGELFGRISVLTGGLYGVGGIYALAVPSAAERACRRTRDLADPGEREAACAEALARLARKGHRSRMIGAGVFCGLGIVGAISASSGDDPSGALPALAYGGGLSLFFFLVKSRAERTYLAYLEERGVRPAPELVLGLGPRGGFRAGLSFDF
ncbi:MAG TPA: hypothetical protein ENO03_02845 [Candidatus Aminicenantes bacterium]|nr:hypothetical protein [Candidatus Aminicenantes bacterium]